MFEEISVTHGESRRNSCRKHTLSKNINYLRHCLKNVSLEIVYTKSVDPEKNKGQHGTDPWLTHKYKKNYMVSTDIHSGAFGDEQ